MKNMKLADIKAGAYVVLNDAEDANIYLVTNVNGRIVTIVNADVSNGRPYSCDYTLVFAPTKEQLES